MYKVWPFPSMVPPSYDLFIEEYMCQHTKESIDMIGYW